MPDTAVIIVNGTLDNPDLIRKRLAGRIDRSTPVIAADGGSRHAAPLGLTITALVGDLDSLPPEVAASLTGGQIHLEQHDRHKDETDLELALAYAIKQGASTVIVIGALGGRLDMTLSNVLLLLLPALAGVRVELWHADQTAWLIRPPGDRVLGNPGDTLSLIPLGGAATGITTENLAYPLENETLLFGPARGISNVMQENEARIALEAGILLAVHTPGKEQKNDPTG